MEVSSNHEKEDPNDKENFHSYNELLHILQSSTLPEQTFGFDQPYEVDMFKEYVPEVQSNISKSIRILRSTDLKSFQNASIRKDIVINTVFLCGEHSENNIWTSAETLNLSNLLLKELLKKCNCSTLTDLLIQLNCESFISKLRFKLNKTSWKNFPAAVSCFKWILTNIKCPHLGGLLSRVLPTCLLLVDDHEYSNKIIGLSCLQHVSTHVSRTELAQYGRGAVIYKAVEHMFYLRKPEIIRPLASCLVVLLSSTEHQPKIATLTWNHFDDVLNIWLPCMEMEQQVVLREAYIDSIDLLIAAMGLSSVRWSRKLLNVLSEYCENDNTQVKAVQCLQTFIHASWPKVSSNFQSIVLILMKVILRSSSRNEPILHVVKDCLQLLETLSKPLYNKFISDVKGNSEMSFLYSVISVH